MGYGLDKQIHDIYDVRLATQAELEAYHDHDYIEFLKRHAEGCVRGWLPYILTFFLSPLTQRHTAESKRNEEHDRCI